MDPASQSGPDPRIHIPRTSRSRLSTYTVISSVAPLHARATRRSGQETQLLYGQQFDVYELKRGWVWGQERSPVKGSRQKGYVGYIALRMLEDIKTTPSHIVTALKAPVFVAPDIKSHIFQSLPMNALIKGQGRHKAFVQIGAGGYVHRKHLRKLNEAPALSDFVEVAEQHLGLPYIWGGISTRGLDCSGLVLSSLRATGQDVPRDTDMQQVELGEAIPVSQRGLKRGDLVFWKGHVGIMQNATRLLHANAFHMKVVSEPLREAVNRIEAGGGGPMTAIKRL